MGKSYVGDIGTRIRVTLNTSLADATTIKFLIKRPNGTELEKTGTIESIPLGIVWCDTITDDFNTMGEYFVQVKVTFVDGDIIKSETQRFPVYNSYD